MSHRKKERTFGKGKTQELSSQITPSEIQILEKKG